MKKYFIPIIILTLFFTNIFADTATKKCKVSYIEVVKAHKYGQAEFIRKSIEEKRRMSNRQLHEYNSHNLSLLYNKLNKIYITKQFCVEENEYMRELLNDQDKLEKMINGILVLQKYYERKMKLGL